MTKKLFILGGGGHCLSCLDIISSEQHLVVSGIIEREGYHNSLLKNIPVFPEHKLNTLVNENHLFFLAIGKIGFCTLREQKFKLMKSFDISLETIIAKTSYVSSSSKIMEGVTIMHQCFVNANAVIGKNTIINTQSLIEHESIIGNHCHVSTGVKINGGVKIGDSTFIGSGCVIYEGVNIGKNVSISAGSIVKRDLPSKTFYS